MFPSVQNTYSVSLVLCSVYVNIEFLFFMLGFGENRIFNEGSLNGGSQMEKRQKESRVVLVGGLRGQVEQILCNVSSLEVLY